jgi:hypothetical protein
MTALESVDCVPTGSAGDDGALYLERRPETLCWAGAGDSASLSVAHWPLGVLAAVVLAAYSVGYPLASLLFIYCQFFHKQNAAPSVLERHSALVKRVERKLSLAHQQQRRGASIELTAVVGSDAQRQVDIDARAFAGGTTTLPVTKRGSGGTSGNVTIVTVLPLGWVELTDPASGAPYYEHVESGGTQWARPWVSDASSPAEWRTSLDPSTSTWYFVNEFTGESLWELPEGASLLVTDDAEDVPAGARRSVGGAAASGADADTGAECSGQGAGEVSSERRTVHRADGEFYDVIAAAAARVTAASAPTSAEALTHAPSMRGAHTRSAIMRSMAQIGLTRKRRSLARPPQCPRTRAPPPRASLVGDDFKLAPMSPRTDTLLSRVLEEFAEPGDALAGAATNAVSGAQAGGVGSDGGTGTGGGTLSLSSGKGRRHSSHLDVHDAIERKGKKAAAYRHFFDNDFRPQYYWFRQIHFIVLLLLNTLQVFLTGLPAHALFAFALFGGTIIVLFLYFVLLLWFRPMLHDESWKLPTKVSRAVSRSFMVPPDARCLECYRAVRRPSRAAPVSSGGRRLSALRALRYWTLQLQSDERPLLATD